MIDGFDTGYRSADWDERDEDWKRLDYHDLEIQLAADEMRDTLRKAVRGMGDGREHIPDHVRNILALLLRNVFGNGQLPPEVMRAAIYALGDQAYREDCIRRFHASAP